MTTKKMTLREAIDHPNLSVVRGFLKDYRDRSESVLPTEYRRRCRQLKRQAVARNDQLTAKAVWCLETVGEIQDHFVTAFANMRMGDYKEAWDLLERCEIEISILDKHFTESDKEFGIEHVRIHTRRFQEIFPFTMGVSPAYIRKDIRCSICDARLTLRSGCKHKVGEIYDGEMCAKVITELDIIEISLVDRPAQKFSVIFPNGNDDPRLHHIQGLARRLESPWRGWFYYKEERKQFHPAFRNVGRDDRCPCGSNLKYKHCCLNRAIVFPYFQLISGGITLP